MFPPSKVYTMLWLCIWLSITTLVNCSPPDDHIKCASKNSNCTITNSYGTFPDRSVCRAADVAYPASEEELISIVATSTMQKRKMRVTTRYSHSVPKLVCVDSPGGLLISTKLLNRIVKIDAGAMTVTVESGVTLRQLIGAAAEAGMALPYAPYWWGLTVGGMVSTGAHGSSLWGKGSAVHEYVVEMRIVTPATSAHNYAVLRSLRQADQDLNAAKLGLGVLGVISQVTLKLEPMFKRSISYVTETDANLSEQVVKFGREHEFGDIAWHPSQHQAIYRIDDRVPLNVLGNGLYDNTAFRSTLSSSLAIVRTTEENRESRGDAEGKCSDGKFIVSTLKTSAFGLTNDGIAFTGYPVIGYQNRVQASGSCLDSPEDSLLSGCAWDSRLKATFFHQTAFSISLAYVDSFIRDVQELVHLNPTALCSVDLYNGILMRYVKASTAYLGKQEDSVELDFTYYRSRDPMAPRLNEDVLEEIEQMAVFKYGGVPHWGKNRNVVFQGAFRKYRKGGEFLKVKERYDPQGLFSNEWTDQVLGLSKQGVIVVKEGCALEGLCVCSEDIHCAPTKGYYCRMGKVYKDARVCSKVDLVE